MDIIIPAPVPPGAKHQEGEALSGPICDRCKRTTTERNPILLDQRPSEILSEALAGKFRCDALCVECRESMRATRGRVGPLAVPYRSDYGSHHG
jgi:hypothetical protein